MLLIVADDYGWNDVGYHTNHSAVGYLNTANPSGLPVTNAAAGIMRTPTIDRLAHEGIKLEKWVPQEEEQNSLRHGHLHTAATDLASPCAAGVAGGLFS